MFTIRTNPVAPGPDPCYGPAPVRKLSTSRATRTAVVLAGLAVATSVPIALGADSSGRQARLLEAQRAALAANSNTALLTLYALESELTRARSAAAAAAARQASVAARQAATRRQLAIARRALHASERNLALLVRALYEQNGLDPLAIVLGAESLDAALTGLDDLDRAAGQSTAVLEQARLARARLGRVDARLAARAAALARAADAATARREALEAKAAERTAYLAELRRREGITEARLAVLQTRAKAAERRAAALPASTPAAPAAAVAATVAPASPGMPAEAAPAEPAPAETPAAAPTPPPAAAPASGERTMTVSAVGYSLPGTTASGLPVGHGIMAVDPSVIPMGTRVYVPGYGQAVAADTGSAVRGAMIDLWFPTTADALRWGRKTVVITIR